MSQENVEVVRQLWDVYADGIERGDRNAGLAGHDKGLFAPESTYTPAREAPDTKTFVSREGFAQFFREWTALFAELTVAPQEFIDAGDDRVVAIVDASAIGKGSGAPVEFRLGIVYTFKDGLIADRQDYLDPADALEAVGLR